MNFEIWRPLNRIDVNKYLYHYTSIDKALNILYYDELWFSNLTSTNDIFEQKVKMSFQGINNYHKSTAKEKDEYKKNC